MIDAYEVGQRLTADDFADDIYLPSAKWDYAEVMDIDENTVTLHYVDVGMGTDDTQIWTRAEMEEMLGWSISRDDNVFDVIDERDEEEPESDSKGLAEDILTNSTIDEKNGSYALLRGSKPALMRMYGNRVSELHIFSTDEAARKRFKELIQ